MLRYEVDVDAQAPRRYCALVGRPEVQKLKVGYDFRAPEFRREVFLRFYEAHLRMFAHPGLVYLLMPYFKKKYNWDMEACLWFAFINGNTQNPVTSRLIFDRFPNFKRLNTARLATWFATEYQRLEFDSDRKWQKKDFIKAVECYRALCGSSQEDFFAQFTTNHDEGVNFQTVWPVVRKKFETFGRLATFSYLEYLRVMGLPIDCNDLFLEDLGGSKSHRNGLSKVLGLDVWDWHPQSNPAFTGKYTPEMLTFLKTEAAQLLDDARRRFKGERFAKDVSYFTLESTLCCYKGSYRKNRRYAGVYIDMHHDRVRRAEAVWPRVDFSDQWEARRAGVPKYFLMECNPKDPGLRPQKQNHFRDTGEVIMLNYWWPEFSNAFNRWRDSK